MLEKIKSNNFLKKYWAVLIVLFFALLASRSLFGRDYFIMHDDLQMMRQLEMEKCFLDGQIPCRWVPDMGYGFGFPLFNYYPPLPYLIGEIFRVVGFSFVMTAKLTFALSFFVSGLGMYFFVKNFFGRLGGVLSSIFYIWAPYHALDIFVRGAMNEAWALAFFPFIFWFAYELIKEKKNAGKWIILLSLAWFALLTSHNLMVLIFTPFFGLWVFIHVIHQKSYKRLPHFIFSGLLALGLAAFFTVPVLLEQGFVQIETLIQSYYQYWAHFASFYQLFFSRFWGDGPSAFGINDQMAFPVGHLHWIVSLLALGLFALLLKGKKRIKKQLDTTNISFLFMFSVGWFSAFMAHAKSSFIWEFLTTLKYVQFPWRFLTLTIFGMAFVAGFLPYALEKIVKGEKAKRINRFVFIFLSVILLLLNWNYFKPVRSGPLTDEEKFSGEAWRIQQQAGIYDYLPKTANIAPESQRGELIEVIEGEAEIITSGQGTDWASFEIEVESEEAEIRLNILQYPEWKVFVDGEEIPIFIPEEEDWGRIYMSLSQGRHKVGAELFDTPARKAANIVSLVFWLGLLGYLLWPRPMN